MTLPATSKPFGGHLPSADDKAMANQLRRILAADGAGNAALRILAPGIKRAVPVTLTPAMTGLFLDLLRHIAGGSAVTLVPIQQQLTTQQAADLLNMSRPYLIRLLENGSMPFTLVGRHRRVRADDVFAYKSKRDAERGAALDDLMAGDNDLI